MKTLFAIFNNYKNAKSAIKNMLEKNYELLDMNVIIPVDIAKTNLKESTGKRNRNSWETEDGLDQMVAGEQSITIMDVGEVYASGNLATEFTKTASVPKGAGEGLNPALQSFNIPPETSTTYINHIKQGGILFFIRLPDERAAEAANILRFHKGNHVYSFA